MNYFDAMKKLKLFNENRKALYQTLNIPYNITKKAQDRMSACEEITPHNLKRMTCIFAESGEGVWAPGLKESVRQSCRSLQIPYSPALQNATAAYENTLSRIHALQGASVRSFAECLPLFF